MLPPARVEKSHLYGHQIQYLESTALHIKKKLDPNAALGPSTKPKK